MAGDERKPMGEPPEDRPSFKVDDRRHWARPLDEENDAQEENTDRPEPPPGDTLLDSYRAERHPVVKNTGTAADHEIASDRG